MTERILIGAFPDGGRGIRVSEAGYDVRTTPVDNERMIFNSDWPDQLALHAQGSFTQTRNAVEATVTFAALGYRPLVMMAIKPFHTTRNFMPAFDKRFYQSLQSAGGGTGGGLMVDGVIPSFTDLATSLGYFYLEVYADNFKVRYVGPSNATFNVDWPTSFSCLYAIFKQKAD